MMKLRNLTISFLALALSAVPVTVAAEGISGSQDRKAVRELREALRLHDMGMTDRASTMLRDISLRTGSVDAEGYSVLCDVITAVPGYEIRMDRFLSSRTYSRLVPQIRYQHALNLFRAGDYKTASEWLETIKPGQLYRSGRTEFLFNRAYCNFENQDYATAYTRFDEVQKQAFSDYTSPSRYAMGYIKYRENDFAEALKWFEQSSKDGRFASVSNWYIIECRFMMKDYAYVTSHAPAMFDKVPEDRRPAMARMISESYMVQGDAENARKYLDLNAVSDSTMTRTDWFHRGSVLYAVKDYKSAVESFNMMGERKDSLGQIANYSLGYSYIKTRNKVAAMGAFRDASLVEYDPEISEDAYFNYAKLAFDLNDDSSVFEAYMQKYPGLRRDDKINSYMAVAALHKKDYAGAIEAYDRVEEMDRNMTDNYMKANYLRACQLVSNGAYRNALPCLEASAYYAGKGTRFNQLSRYWMAESYFRDSQYEKARAIYIDLYNTSALYNSPEAHLITYNLAYCYFMDKDYANALKWLDKYLEEDKVVYRKDALERKGDCYFITKKYGSAASAYSLVVKDYFDADDIYPYYQAALACGLSNDKAGKVKLLENVRNASEESPFYSEALYELGRCYVAEGNDDKAFECFDALARNMKDGNYVAKAYLELGSISRNRNDLDKALEYYRIVVEQLPMSGYGEDALLAIENIYRAKNQAEDYVSYIERIGKGASKTEDEKEELIFSSAEQVYLSDNYKNALVSLKAYLDKYPSGKNFHKAKFYMAESYKALDMKEQACDCYETVISDGGSAFVEISMLNYSQLSYQLEKWDDALGGYTSLLEAAKFDVNRFNAKVGMMRSAFKGRKWRKSVAYADVILEEEGADAALKEEAVYIKAKSYLAQSKRTEAITLLEELAKTPSTQYGAEATYMLIQDCYDRGDFTGVEDRTYAFSGASAGQPYWLAKSFIVLGDSFADQGELKQAQATFESIRNAYTPKFFDDDVLDNVNMRLTKLQTMIDGKK